MSTTCPIFDMGAALAPIAVGAGALLGGVGLFRGGSKVGNAAQSMAHQTDQTLKNLTAEVQHMREFVIKEAWPEINATLVKLHGTLHHVDNFLLTATDSLPIIVRAIAIPLLIYAALLCFSLLSKISRRSAERIVVIILYYMSLFLALFLMVNLIRDILAFERPHNVTVYIIIIPAVGVVIEAIRDLWYSIKHFPERFAELFAEIFIRWPICLFFSPILNGQKYNRYNFPILYLFIFSFYCIFWGGMCFIMGYWLLAYLTELNRMYPPWKMALICYGVFYAAAFLINLITLILISAMIRPSWAYCARMHHIKRTCK